MGITFIFILAVTLFCPVQTKPLTESPSQDLTGAAHHFNVAENVIKVTQDEDAPVTSKNQTVKNEVKTCRSTEFSCDDKHKSCLPMIWRCDGDKDCVNGADEEDCVETCEFSCDDKQRVCVPLRWRCDGDKDCLNGADEEDCVTQDDTSKNQTVKNEVMTCRSTEFSCGDKRKTCLPLRWRCDGDKDCVNGADEEDCVTQDAASKNQTVKNEVETCEFSCDDKQRVCVPLRWRCDGDKDCVNGADEEDCVTQDDTSKNQTVKNEVKTCRSTEFSCGDKRKTCLPLRWRCDGDKDCLNGSDEEDCDDLGSTQGDTRPAASGSRHRKTLQPPLP